ncbi:MAG: hypothetical protein QUS09_04330, partial [Methanotrichaceae archaeon]|nr:hypothetical protein [Methanotrichaceae archaeon]
RQMCIRDRALGVSQAYPLQGGNENVKATLFGAVRIPLEDQNATEEILKLDIGLIGAENATYELVDDDNLAMQPSLYKNLQPGRQMLYFIIPKDDLFKLLKVTPAGGAPFNINWWATPKGTNGDVLLRYYGITDWIWDSDQQAIVFELRIGNNGTAPFYIGPENFTLLDQWGWDYYPVVGFEPMVIEPQMATGRVKVGFSGLSILSRPFALAYDYTAPNQIIIDLEKGAGQLSDAQVYGSNTPQSAPAATATPAATSAPAVPSTTMQAVSAPQNQSSTAEGQTNESQQNGSAQNQATSAKILSLKDQINASRERLKGVGKDSSADGQSTVGKKISSSVDEAKERLAMARSRLKENNQTT